MLMYSCEHKCSLTMQTSDTIVQLEREAAVPVFDCWIQDIRSCKSCFLVTACFCWFHSEAVVPVSSCLVQDISPCRCCFLVTTCFSMWNMWRRSCIVADHSLPHSSSLSKFHACFKFRVSYEHRQTHTHTHTHTHTRTCTRTRTRTHTHTHTHSHTLTHITHHYCPSSNIVIQTLVNCWMVSFTDFDKAV